MQYFEIIFITEQRIRSVPSFCRIVQSLQCGGQRDREGEAPAAAQRRAASELQVCNREPEGLEGEVRGPEQLADFHGGDRSVNIKRRSQKVHF